MLSDVIYMVLMLYILHCCVLLKKNSHVFRRCVVAKKLKMEKNILSFWTPDFSRKGSYKIGHVRSGSLVS